MNRMAWIGVLLTIWGGSATAQNSPAERFVTQYAQKKNTWLIQKQYDSLRLVLDSRCLYIHSNGWVQQAGDVITDLQSGKLIYETIDVQETTARQFEHMVIITGKGRFAGTVNGNAFDMTLMFTEVYVKRKAGWKLVSRHSNKIS